MCKTIVNYLNLIILLFLVSCTGRVYVSKPNFQLRSYYGFIVYNENGNYFYKIEDKHVQNYIDRNVNDTNVINSLIKKTKYVYSYDGKSIEYYAWGIYETLFLEKENQLIEINIPNCTKILKSKVVPVLIVSLDHVTSLVSQMDECNKFLNKKLFDRPGLSIMFINPLDRKKAGKYQDLRDTISLNSPAYQKFLKSGVH